MNCDKKASLLRSWVAILCAITLVSGDTLAYASESSAAPANPPSVQTNTLPADQLDSLVAPIALYPDPLLAQTLAASTYPLEVVLLQRWLETNKNLKDQQLADAAAKQPWDPSVQALAALPEVVKLLGDNIQWTTDLGNAFLAQQNEVMNAVQRMRRKAQDKGALHTTQQQTVETKVIENESVVVIEPANPEVVYVPSYDSAAVYGAPVYPYPPLYYPAGYYAAGAALAFGAGVLMGAWWGGGWGWGCGWGGGGVYVNHNNNFNRNSISGGVGGVGRPGGIGGVGRPGGVGGVGRPGGVGGVVGGVGGVGKPGGVGGVGKPGGVGGVGGVGGNRASTLPAQGGLGQSGLGNWTHNPVHRGGTPYSDRATADRFGGSARGDSLTQRQAGARQQIGRQGGKLTSKPAAGGGFGGYAGNARAGNRAGGVGSANRIGGAGSAGGADRIGGRNLSRGGAGDRNAFGGGSRGFNGSNARSNSNRGSSSMRSRGGFSRGGGGFRSGGGRSGGGFRGGGGRGGGGRGGGGRRR